VEIIQPGSYRLTSNPMVPDANTTAIEIAVSDVTHRGGPRSGQRERRHGNGRRGIASCPAAVIVNSSAFANGADGLSISEDASGPGAARSEHVHEQHGDGNTAGLGSAVFGDTVATTAGWG
jgi:hypothetical protein